MTKTFKYLVIASFFAALLSSTAMAQGSAPSGPAAVIQIKDFDFKPMDVSIAAGGSVSWKNLDGEPHTVTGVDGAFRSGALDQNESFTFRFDKPGVYQYLCSIHPKMRGTVTVK